MAKSSNGYIFPVRRPKTKHREVSHIGSLKRAHELVIEKTFPKDPFTIYTFRHTCGTRHSQAGTELPVLAELLFPDRSQSRYPPGATIPGGARRPQLPAPWRFGEICRLTSPCNPAGEVWVKNKDIQVDLAGSLRVSKAAGQERLAVAGVMRAEKGTIDIQGHAFKVAEGTVTLSGKPGVPGILAGRALSEIDEVTLMLDISGPANKPVLQFSSNPGLPPADVLSYLVYGRPAAALSREEYNTVGQQALGVLGGVTTKKLKEIFGENTPLVCDLSMRCGEQTVGVSKPLTKQLSVTLEHKTNPLYRDNTEQMRLEYKVNKYLGADSTMGLRNTGGDVLFNYDF